MTVSQRIERHLQKRGTVRSLSKTLSELGISYAWGWTCVQLLEAAGKIKIKRNGSGSPLIISHISHTGPHTATPSAHTPPDTRCPTNGK